MPKPIFPPLAWIRQRIRYAPDTGHLYWLHRREGDGRDANWNARHEGTLALATPTSRGYLQGSLGEYRLLAHRVAWALYHGEWPPEQIDHINRNKQDNRISNLRAATPSENMLNRDFAPRRMGCPRGVRWVGAKQKFHATLSIRGQKKHLGSFDSADAASAAYEAALSASSKCGGAA